MNNTIKKTITIEITAASIASVSAAIKGTGTRVDAITYAVVGSGVSFKHKLENV